MCNQMLLIAAFIASPLFLANIVLCQFSFPPFNVSSVSSGQPGPRPPFPPPPGPPGPWPMPPCPPPPCPPGPGPCPPPPPPHYHHHGPPPFLCNNVTRNGMQQYMQIVMSPNDTKAVIKNNLQSWAQSNGVADAYANFTTEQQQKAQQFHDNVTANLAGQALQLFTQIWNIRQDDSINRVVECQQLQSALNGTNPIVFHLVPLPPPAIFGSSPRPCGPPRLPPHFGPGSMEGGDFGGGPMMENNE